MDRHFTIYKSRKRSYSIYILIKLQQNKQTIIKQKFMSLSGYEELNQVKYKAFYLFCGGMQSIRGEMLSLIQQILSTR